VAHLATGTGLDRSCGCLSLRIELFRTFGYFQMLRKDPNPSIGACGHIVHQRARSDAIVEPRFDSVLSARTNNRYKKTHPTNFFYADTVGSARKCDGRGAVLTNDSREN